MATAMASTGVVEDLEVGDYQFVHAATGAPMAGPAGAFSARPPTVRGEGTTNLRVHHRGGRDGGDL